MNTTQVTKPILLMCLFLLCSCTVLSPQTRLDSQVQEPTPIEEVDITIIRMGFLEAGWECARLNNIPEFLHPLVVQIFGCATTTFVDGKVTECEVILGTDSEFIKNHEINHCLGYID